MKNFVRVLIVFQAYFAGPKSFFNTTFKAIIINRTIDTLLRISN